MDDVSPLRAVRAPQGFREGVLRRVGLLDRYARVRSPIGMVYVALADRGITAVIAAADDAEFERLYRERVGRRAERRDDLAPELERAVAGESPVDVDLRRCNAFQRAVLEATRTIPAGSVRPYAWIARAIGRPGAVRAVGTALGKNPVPLVIPCHRVVRSDGESGQYSLGAGPADKVRLLRHEGVDIADMRRRVSARTLWAREGETTYCYPYCYEARQLVDARFIEFEDPSEARRRGFTPCATCRPPLAA